MYIKYNWQGIKTFIEEAQAKPGGLDSTQLRKVASLAAITSQIFQQSQELVPVKTGRLKKSAKIYKKGTGYVIRYETPYAVYVHEIIDNAHRPPTQAKFLENAAYSKRIELKVRYNLVLDFELSIEETGYVSLYIKRIKKGRGTL